MDGGNNDENENDNNCNLQVGSKHFNFGQLSEQFTPTSTSQQQLLRSQNVEEQQLSRLSSTFMQKNINDYISLITIYAHYFIFCILFLLFFIIILLYLFFQ